MVVIGNAREKARINKSLSFSSTLGRGLYPVGKWGFENNVEDSSGLGNNGTIHGNPQYVDGMVGKALDFDGSGDYVEVVDNDSLDITTSITVEAWVNGDKWDTNDIIVHKNSAYGLWYDWTGTSADNNEFQFMFHGGGAWRVCDSDFNPKINTWYHIAGSYNRDKNKCHFYVDGELKKTNTYNQQINNSTVLRIGGWTNNVYCVDGTIDEVRIYNEAISSSQIRENYYAGLKRLLAKGEISGEEYEEKLVKR